MQKIKKVTARHKAAAKKHVKRVHEHVAKRVSPRVRVRIIQGVALALLAVILLRPVVWNATAIHLNYNDCVPVASRKFNVKSNQTVRIKVTSQTDSTFVLEKFHVRKDLKAHKTAHITFKAAAGSDWYGYKLEHCRFEGYMGIVDQNGNDPRMDNVDHKHNPTEEEKQNDAESSEHQNHQDMMSH